MTTKSPGYMKNPKSQYYQIQNKSKTPNSKYRVLFSINHVGLQFGILDLGFIW